MTNFWGQLDPDFKVSRKKRPLPKPLGPICKTCGEPLSKVVDSRPGNNSVIRKRVCSNGHIVKTVEYER